MKIGHAMLGQRGRLSAILACVGLAACSLGTGPDNKPTRAEIEITGTSPVPLRLIISTDFFEVQDDVTLEIGQVFNSADTLTIDALPYQRTVQLTDDASIVVDLANLAVEPAQVRLRVELDNPQEPYDRSATMSEGGSLRYVFTYFEHVL